MLRNSQLLFLIFAVRFRSTIFMFGVSTSGHAESPGPPQVTLNENPIPEKIKVCKFFVKNQTCQFGKKCRFLHPEESYPVYVQRSFAVENEAVSEEDAAPRTSKPKVYVPPHRLRPRVHHATVNRSQAEEEPLPINQNTFGQVCKFFSRNGFCKFGDSCKYLHELNHGNDDFDQTDVRERANYGGRRGGRRGRGFNRQQIRSGIDVNTHDKRETKSFRPGKQKPRTRQLCRYFKEGDCRHGDQCKFWHPSDLPEVDQLEGNAGEVEELTDQLGALSASGKESEAGKSQPNKRRIVVQPTSEFSIETLTDEDAANHRVAEVNLLLKRFPRAEITALPRRKEEAYKIVFTPTDPDWVCRPTESSHSSF